MVQALVIGGGPAGLMAAEVMGKAGLSVLVVDRMPTMGRKFLMAGKSGLNLTKEENPDAFHAAYREATAPLLPALTAFGPADLRDWAEGLGQTLFVGSTGRVFPKAMKTSPLLRAWFQRLDDLGVERRTRWQWSGLEDGSFSFETPEGAQSLHPEVCVLALGGASWSRLGSDGGWAKILESRGIPVAPFQPANAGLHVKWSEHMTRHFGAPLKNIALSAGGARARGEIVISKHGLEGGGIYTVFRDIREGAALHIDLLPDLPTDDVVRRIARPRGKTTLTNHLRKTLKLSPAALALAREGSPLPTGTEALAALLKRVPVDHEGPRPMDEAISTAGGVRFDALDDGLMLQAIPGVFCAGEMLDWEAPTGGYLLSACLATGRQAGHAAARRLRA